MSSTEGYGYDFPPVRERMDRLEEALRDHQGDVHRGPALVPGEHYQIEQALNVPRPVQRRRSADPRRWRRRAADAPDRGEVRPDMTHWFPLGLEMLKHKNDVLDAPLRGDRPGPVDDRADDDCAGDRDGHGRGEARRRSRKCPPERRPYVNVGPPDQVADGLRPYIEAGFTGFTFNNNVYRTPEQIADRGRPAGSSRARLGRAR